MDPKGAKMVKGALFRESLLATVPGTLKGDPNSCYYKTCKAVISGHFIRQNHIQAAQFVSLVPILGILGICTSVLIIDMRVCSINSYENNQSKSGVFNVSIEHL